MPPRISERLPETCQCGDNTCCENGPTTTEEVVEGDCKPTADKGAAEVGRRIDEAEEPGVLGAILVADAELFGVEDLGTIYNGFVWVLVSDMLKIKKLDVTYPFLGPQHRWNRGQ
jgi:hypothetical protein